MPDPPGVLTSNAGWETKKHFDFLRKTCEIIHSLGVRSSIFIEPNIELIEYAKKIGVHRIEFYTGPYAENYNSDPEKAISEYATAAEFAHKLGLGINAGHDLNQENLKFFKSKIPFLAEVSIGHAIISDALYLGIENTIQRYKLLLA